MVYRLYKEMYGLKQDPRAWNMRINIFFINHGFKKSSVEYGVYVKYKQGEILLLAYLYVNDLFDN